MLSFTRKTDYALISLTHMVGRGDNPCSAREIATTYKMPMPLLMNILKVLTQKGLAQSIRGPRGGYQLAKPPEEINLHEIIAAVDGPVSLVQCLKHPSDARRVLPRRAAQEAEASEDGGQVTCGCDLTGVCPVRTSVHRIHHRLVSFLKQITLAEIADNTACRNLEVDAVSGGMSHEVAHLS